MTEQGKGSSRRTVLVAGAHAQLVSWGYGDFAFRKDFDNVSKTVKVRQAGFHDCIDSETMFREFFQSLRK